MSSRMKRATGWVAGVGMLVAVAAGTAVGVASAATAHAAKIGGSVSIWAEWTGAEQTQFEAVLKPFEKSTGITVNYAGKGSGTMDTALETAVKGGSPPDVALVPDPGTLQTLAHEHAIKPLGPVIGSESKNYAPAWNKLASVGASFTASGSRAPTRTPSSTTRRCFTPPGSRRHLRLGSRCSLTPQPCEPPGPRRSRSAPMSDGRWPTCGRTCT